MGIYGLKEVARATKVLITPITLPRGQCEDVFLLLKAMGVH
jgi:hypothetical protein